LAREWSRRFYQKRFGREGLIEEVIGGHKGFAGGDSQEEVCLAVVSGPNQLMLVFQRKGKEEEEKRGRLEGEEAARGRSAAQPSRLGFYCSVVASEIAFLVKYC
jgi:hypothetical protein